MKAFALEHGIAVAQPRGLRLDGKFGEDAAAAREALLRAAAPDVIVVAAYGLILPPWLLALPRHGCLNIHASLLPRWRGAAPIQRAIEAGDDVTGVTIMQMDAGLDTGAMLARRDASRSAPTKAPARSRPSWRRSAASSSSRRSARSPSGPLVGRRAARGRRHLRRQDHKAEATIDWRAPAATIERRLRAFDPAPGARSVAGGETITCWRGVVVARDGGRPGGSSRRRRRAHRSPAAKAAWR